MLSISEIENMCGICEELVSVCNLAKKCEYQTQLLKIRRKRKRIKRKREGLIRSISDIDHVIS